MFAWVLVLDNTQRTQTSFRRLQDVLKRSRRLASKPDVVTTSGRRHRIYDVLRTSDLRCHEDDLRRLENVPNQTSVGEIRLADV